MPPQWLIYVATTDADASAIKCAELNGTVIVQPFDVSSLGRMAVLRDPTGGVFAVWQAKSHAGLGIVHARGALCWADLSTPAPETAAPFYSSLFGWQMVRSEHDSSGYLHIKNGETFIGGIPPTSFRNPTVPCHWLIYFLVDDCDTTANRAVSLGASFRVPPFSMKGVGRIAIIADPQGAVFAIFQQERPVNA